MKLSKSDKVAIIFFIAAALIFLSSVLIATVYIAINGIQSQPPHWLEYYMLSATPLFAIGVLVFVIGRLRSILKM